MVSAEVQRTLVKSPPELWAELSDPTSLARHLGELGDIRIVRTNPETSVEWAAENISGTVSIKASGWGTKVTLSVTREFALDEPAAVEEPATFEEPTAEEPAPVTLEVAPAEQPEPRRGFFARLFGRRRKDAQTPRETPLYSDRPIDAFAAVSRALAPEAVATTHPFDPPPGAEAAPPTTPSPELQALAVPAAEETEPAPAASEPGVDISAELLAAEQVAVEQVTAVLTATLDRLGAAHHRPFSRA
jgi:hypothetical protein